MDVAKEVRAIINSVTGHNVPENLSLETSIADIGITSIDLLILSIELEDHFQLNLPDDILLSWRSVADVIETVQRFLVNERK